MAIGWLIWGSDSDDEASTLAPTPTPEARSGTPSPPTPVPEALISIAFGPQQIWSFSDSRDPAQRGAIAALHECAPRDVDWNDCIWEVMQQYGASRDAFDFFRLTDGFLEDLQGEGTVRLGTIVYPWRANENVQPILLGGDPPIVELESPALHSAVEHDPGFTILQSQHPHIMFWGAGPSLESSSSTPDGSQVFIFRYRLLDGCHACEVLGYARIEFDFFPSGLLDITTPRLLGVIEKED